MPTLTYPAILSQNAILSQILPLTLNLTQTSPHPPSLLRPLAYLTIFAFGIVIGSFLNVCIYRIPRHETVVTTPSHCMNCGYPLRWFDLIPVFSWLALRGRCRKCGERISVQYPLIEAGNGLLWVATFALCGFSVLTLLDCLAVSALLVISLVDARTFEIPFSCNVFIGILGIFATIFDFGHMINHIAGFFGVALLLLLVYVLTGGRGIGGGDIKLMAATGLLLGFGCNLAGFLFGCLYASVIHIARMKLSGAESMLAMGPYLAAGTLTAIWFGERIVTWYLGFLV